MWSGGHGGGNSGVGLWVWWEVLWCEGLGVERCLDSCGYAWLIGHYRKIYIFFKGHLRGLKTRKPFFIKGPWRGLNIPKPFA